MVRRHLHPCPPSAASCDSGTLVVLSKPFTICAPVQINGKKQQEHVPNIVAKKHLEVKLTQKGAADPTNTLDPYNTIAYQKHKKETTQGGPRGRQRCMPW